MITDTKNSVQVNDEPLMTTISSTVGTLLTPEIDSRVTKIRPMATPIDQLSRCGDVRRCGSMTVNYYQVDVKDVSTTVTKAPDAFDIVSVDDDYYKITLKVKTATIFSKSETAMMPAVEVDGNPLVLYVTEVNDDKIVATIINEGVDTSELTSQITKDAMVVRMGRAAAELDVQSPQFETLPKRSRNYCQIFKMQVEESTLHRLSNKEAEWNFSDQEEIAIIDMRQGMEKNFIFGQAAKLAGPHNDEIYLTGGVWNQGVPSMEYDPETLDESTLISMCRTVFTGQGGTSRKILIGGSDFVETLSNMPRERVVLNTSTFVRWGLEFNEIKTNFGTLYLIHSEIFDQCGHSADAMIIDPAMLTKYVHIPFTTEKLDLRSSGQRNTDAVVITEASCVVLRNPKAHLRVIAKKS